MAHCGHFSRVLAGRHADARENLAAAVPPRIAKNPSMRAVLQRAMVPSWIPDPSGLIVRTYTRQYFRRITARRIIRPSNLCRVIVHPPSFRLHLALLFSSDDAQLLTCRFALRRNLCSMGSQTLLSGTFSRLDIGTELLQVRRTSRAPLRASLLHCRGTRFGRRGNRRRRWRR